MGKTRKKRPINRQSRRERLEREWEKQVARLQQEKSRAERALRQEREYETASSPLPPSVQAIKEEAEDIINSRLGAVERARGRRVPFSVQSPSDDTPMEYGGGAGLIWWSGGTMDTYIPLAEYGDPKRIRDIRAFALVSPLILNAEAILTKKIQSLQWTIEGGKNLARKWQKRLNNFENGTGWDTFIARWVRAYCESDNPAYAELIRAAPSWAVDENFQLTPRGARAIELGHDKTWEIVDARVMDPICCVPTTSHEFPLIYRNPYTGQRHRLRAYQFMSLTDMPGVDDQHPHMGVCAISRAVWAAQENRMVIRYSMEKMSENPGSGIAIVNASRNALKTALDSAAAEREARGVVYYKGVIFVPTLNPNGTTSMEFLSFAELPEGFDRNAVYQILKEIVATAFGLDVLEFGSIPGRLGTATQAKVAAQKGRTKSVGAIMQGVERAFRYKLLPESIEFSIKKHDQDEELRRAQIDEIYFNNAIRFAQFADPFLARQYLADKGAIPNEYPYVVTDLTPREQVQDVATPAPEDIEGEGAPQAATAPAIAEGPEGAAEQDVVKRWQRDGPRVRIDRNGKITWVEPLYRVKVLDPIALKYTQMQASHPFAKTPLQRGRYP